MSVSRRTGAFVIAALLGAPMGAFAQGPVAVPIVGSPAAQQAIESLLRGLGTPTTGYGYIVGPPAAQSTSVCGAVMILPTSRPTASASYVPGSSPVAAPLMSGGSPDDEIPPVTPFTPVPP